MHVSAGWLPACVPVPESVVEAVGLLEGSPQPLQTPSLFVLEDKSALFANVSGPYMFQ